ncbi:MAG TPA: tetratricopeptide repeat protein [Candidatus Obscuribacterales bacterium]
MAKKLIDMCKAKTSVVGYRWRLVSSSLLAACTIMLCAQSTPAADEAMILEHWKVGARQSQIGNKLIDLLNSMNAHLRYQPSNKQCLFTRGYLYGIVGCTGMAINDLSKAIQADPYYAAAYAERGICYMDLKNYERARMDLDRAIQLNPRCGDALFARGKLMLETNRPQAAISDFRACQSPGVQFCPALPGELPANYYNGPEYYLGAAYETVGKTDEALRCYKASIRNPRLGGSGYIHRYSDQPLDAKTRVSVLDGTY